METFDCEPTLNDTQVLQFCKQGFLILEGVVPDEINRRMCDYIEEHKFRTFDQTVGNPLGQEDWFVENVIKNPQAAGAVRSLLGANFGLPIRPNNHWAKCPLPAQNWHRDSGSGFGPELNHLQVFYYPQDTPLELGPTELLPGSHFLFSLSTYMGHYGSVRGAVNTPAPAGSIFLTVYSIWHRRSASAAHGIRNLLKYCYWRKEPPRRDWIIDPDFDMRGVEYSLEQPTFRQQHREWYDAAEMFFWVCGKKDEFPDFLGGEGWPMSYAPSRKPEDFHRF